MPTADVKNIYCYADEVGVDASHTFVFNCNLITHQGVIEQLQLKTETVIAPFNTGGFGTQNSWWNKEITMKVKPYSKRQKDLYWYM